MTSSRINRAFLKMGGCFILLAFAITSCLPALSGQELSATQGGLGGAITDKSGAVIPAAQVRVVGSADQRVATADSGGRFTIVGLTPGQYTVTVEAKGFKSTQAKNVDVVINRISNLNMSSSLKSARSVKP